MTTPLDDAIAQYQAHRDRLGLAQTTRVADQIRLAPFLAFCRRHDITDPVAVSPQVLLTFARFIQTKYRGKGTGCRAGRLGPATCIYVLQAVGRLFAYLVKEGRILMSPAAALPVRSPRWPALPRTVEPHEMDALVRVTDDETPVGLRDRAVLEVLFGCGLRRAELVGLDLYDLDLARGCVTVRRGKGGKSRTVPVAGAAHEALLEYLEHGRPALMSVHSDRALFLSSTGRRMNTTTLRDRVILYAAKARLTHPVTLHAFRHGFATSLIRGGADVRHVQELLGHAEIDSTARYMHLQVADLVRVHGRSHPRDRQRGRQPSRQRNFHKEPAR